MSRKKKIKLLSILIVMLAVVLIAVFMKKDPQPDMSIQTETMNVVEGNTQEQETPDNWRETTEPLDIEEEATEAPQAIFYPEDIPEYSGTMVIPINHDEPFFTAEEKKTVREFETYSELDNLKRCGVAYACINKKTMPTKNREDIGNVKPSGWVQAKYHGEWAYNRCHLIAFMLAGENDNRQNLITGTRAFNVDGMLPYESMVSEVVNKRNADVLYRVTPVYDGDNLVAKGVLMEAYCMEYPAECTFCVFVYNVSDDFTIDYRTGETHAA